VTRALADTSLFIAREAGLTLAQTELPDELAIFGNQHRRTARRRAVRDRYPEP
jgi:hypothetical protein